MIKAIRIKDIINRESLGEKQKVVFNTITGEDQEGSPIIDRIEADMHYYERGEGEETVLMLHGPSQSLYTYRNNFEEIAKEGYRVIVPDLLGCGYSDCPDIDYTVEDMSLSLQSFLANLGVIKVHIVAFGQACAYAADIAVNDPELVSSLTFIQPGFFADTAYPKAKSLGGITGNMAAGSFSKTNFVASCMEKCYFDKTLITDKMVDEYARPFERAELKNALRAMVINYEDESIVEKLVSYNKPILFVKSDDDVISNKNDFTRFLHSAQHGYTAAIRNCGYFPHEEKYEMFNESLLEFLNY